MIAQVHTQTSLFIYLSNSTLPDYLPQISRAANLHDLLRSSYRSSLFVSSTKRLGYLELVTRNNMSRAQDGLPSTSLAGAGIENPVLLPYSALPDGCNHRSRLLPSNQSRPREPQPLHQILCYAFFRTKAWMARWSRVGI